MPVLLVSATTDARVMEQAEKVGATTVLRKPVRMDELQRAIVRALGASA
jgi:FixJ family two-component response regulator